MGRSPEEGLARRSVAARTGREDRPAVSTSADRIREKELKKVDPRFREEARRQGICRNPDCRTRQDITAHHIVPKATAFYHHLRDHPHNCMALCERCHSLYNKGRLVIRLEWLRVKEQRMVARIMDRRWLRQNFPTGMVSDDA